MNATLTDVQRFWDANPCLPNETLEHRNGRVQDVLDFIMKDFPFKSALDIGCGTGFEPINYKLKGCERVAGLDLSTKSLEIARQRGDYGIEWVPGNAEALPFKDGEFEFVSAIGSLHHTVNTMQALKELQRVASKQVVVMVYGHEWMVRYNRKDFGIGSKANYDEGENGPCPIVKFYTREQIPQMFRYMKLKDVWGYNDGWGWYARAVRK